MKTIRSISLIVASLSGLALTLQAEEGGSGHYMPGAFATMFDFSPEEPGEATELQFNYYQGDLGGGRKLPLGGQLAANVDAEAFGAVFIMLDTFKEPVAGGMYSVGLAVPWVHITATADVTVGATTTRMRDNCDSIGDICLLPVMLEWRKGLNQWSAILPVYAPTGKYDTGALANTGKNYWTFEPTLAFNRLDPKTWRVLTAFAALDFSTKNTATDYQSGSVFHLELSASQLFPKPTGEIWSIGFNAFFYEQISGDSGSGATLGDFEGHTYGIGPAIGWLKKGKTSSSFAELKWLPELDVAKRAKGNILWLKAGSSW